MYIHKIQTSINTYIAFLSTLTFPTGPSNPAPPTNVTVYGTGVDFVVIQWTVPRLSFTPETYSVEYFLFQNPSDVFFVDYPTVNTNFSTKDVEYTFVVNGLEADNEYSFNVVAANTFGETRVQGYRFQTRNEGI